MVFGTYSVPRVTEESVCRTVKDYRFTNVGIYKVHSTALMPNIDFEEEWNQKFPIDQSILINDEDTMPILNVNIECQNYLTARYIGRAPLEWYGKNQYTEMGREFVMICRNGNTAAEYRMFGTEDAVRGYNTNANDMSYISGGGE